MKQFKLKGYENIDIPKTPGVYFIKLEKGEINKLKINPEINNHKYLKVGDKNGPYDTEKLACKLNASKNDENILYIGKAKDLHKRLGQYMRYLFKGSKNHAGGRAIGQIIGFENLSCEFEENNAPEQKESTLLNDFYENHKSLPFANWRK